MSKLKTLIKMAQAIISSEKFAEAVLKDGSKISYTGEIKVGSEIYSLAPNGDEIVLADGSYETEEGIKFTIASGLVSEVIGSNEDANEIEIGVEDLADASADKENSTDENKAYVDEQVGGLAGKIDSLQAQIDSLKKQIDATRADASLSKTALTKLSQAVEIIGNESSTTKPIETQVTSTVPNSSKQDRATKLAKWFTPTE